MNPKFYTIWSIFNVFSELGQLFWVGFREKIKKPDYSVQENYMVYQKNFIQ